MLKRTQKNRPSVFPPSSSRRSIFAIQGHNEENFGAKENTEGSIPVLVFGFSLRDEFYKISSMEKKGFFF